jgi:hypothetical protein
LSDSGFDLPSPEAQDNKVGIGNDEAVPHLQITTIGLNLADW